MVAQAADDTVPNIADLVTPPIRSAHFAETLVFLSQHELQPLFVGTYTCTGTWLCITSNDPSKQAFMNIGCCPLHACLLGTIVRKTFHVLH